MRVIGDFLGLRQPLLPAAAAGLAPGSAAGGSVGGEEGADEGCLRAGAGGKLTCTFWRVRLPKKKRSRELFKARLRALLGNAGLGAAGRVPGGGGVPQGLQAG